MLNCCMFNSSNFIKNMEIFVKRALGDIGRNAGGVVGNVKNSGVYGAYIGSIGNKGLLVVNH